MNTVQQLVTLMEAIASTRSGYDDGSNMAIQCHHQIINFLRHCCHQAVDNLLFSAPPYRSYGQGNAPYTRSSTSSQFPAFEQSSTLPIVHKPRSSRSHSSTRRSSISCVKITNNSHDHHFKKDSQFGRCNRRFNGSFLLVFSRCRSCNVSNFHFNREIFD